ncbi:MAG: cytochrome c, mono- and diheme variant family [Verrucomicrobiales bacterium]|nr:cytochrome c, mono- and diheme variant family [Verrucomicrobiales bacterium]MDB6130822.1 cytochrome c, mono- and diheme variant family [Verrucomicrobiales bacterium]
MKPSLQLKGIALGAIASCAAFTLVFAVSKMFQPSSAAMHSVGDAPLPPAGGLLASQGYALFKLNCAHCHGLDARGDEGPDLHGVTKSDARIAFLIKNGSKGEMPKFGAKLSDADVRALIAFVRSLRD